MILNWTFGNRPYTVAKTNFSKVWTGGFGLEVLIQIVGPLVANFASVMPLFGGLLSFRVSMLGTTLSVGSVLDAVGGVVRYALGGFASTQAATRAKTEVKPKVDSIPRA